MAFGSSRKAATPANEMKVSGEKFIRPWMDTRQGPRIFRMLPEDEVAWLEAWYPAMQGGERKDVRIILDKNNRWNNPYWEMAQKTDKGSKERKAMRLRFGVNVYDKSMVLFDENGNPVYPDATGKYMAWSKEGKKQITGDPTPLNQIKILEGSNGDEGGKHLLQSLVNLSEELEDNEGHRKLLTEVDLRLVTKGEGIATTRTFYPSANFQPTPEHVLALPRYDIAGWAVPWPDEAVEDVFRGVEFKDICAQYGIKVFPTLMHDVASADTVDDVENLFN